MQNNLSYDNQLNLGEIAHGSLAKQTYSFHAHSGNLEYRMFDNYGTSASNNEYFNYDDFDRLVKTHWHDGTNLVTKHDYNYLANGNIDTKTDCGDYVYGTGQAQHQLTNITSPVTPTISFKHLSFVYNTLKRIETIHENGFTGHHYEFTYGNNSERVMMTYTHSSNPSYTRYYQDNYDRQEEAGSSNYKEWSYVYAPTGLAAVYFNNNGSASLLYVNTDHLGSPILVTNATGSVVAEYSFDSWGRRRDPADWSKYKSFTTPDILIRGYTGHEMLDEVGLVNMNARLYDPILGRMLQTDAYVQAPDLLQNFNRYSYVINNPLKYNDKSGNWFGVDDAIVLGAGFTVGYVGYGLTTGDWGSKAVVAGAAVSVLAEISYLTLGGGYNVAGTAMQQAGAGANFATPFAFTTGQTLYGNKDQISAASANGDSWNAVLLVGGYGLSGALSAGFKSDYAKNVLFDDQTTSRAISDFFTNGVENLINVGYDEKTNTWGGKNRAAYEKAIGSAFVAGLTRVIGENVADEFSEGDDHSLLFFFKKNLARHYTKDILYDSFAMWEIPRKERWNNLGVFRNLYTTTPKNVMLETIDDRYRDEIVEYLMLRR